MFKTCSKSVDKMPYEIPRCQALPLSNHQVSFQIDGNERLRWHYGPQYPRPFFYPLYGPSGTSLTRMGHPGAFNHEHHRSVWFAHHNVMGLDFWSEGKPTRIRQKGWLCYVDTHAEANYAARLGWYDGHDAELLQQELIVGMRPGPEGETLLEIQSSFLPTGKSTQLGKTNFGILAVRVAKNISSFFGGGEITNSDGQVGEPDIFGKPAAWMDYSGPVPGEKTEGITYFDHPGNPGHPVHWHVREDGWMGPGVSRQNDVTIERESPLVLRYLLHLHRGPLDPIVAKQTAAAFAKLPPYEVAKPEGRHRQFTVQRVG